MARLTSTMRFMRFSYIKRVPKPRRSPENSLHASLMITCLADTFFPDVGVATVKLLRRLGVAVDFPQAQTCCGQPHFNSGYHDEARSVARHTIAAFASSPCVVT